MAQRDPGATAPPVGRDAYPVGFKALAYALEIVPVIGETARKGKYSANGILSLSCSLDI